MNVDSTFLKQVLEQPDYVEIDPRLARLQRTGVVRLTPIGIHYGPIFFDQVSVIQKQLEEQITNLQKCSIQHNNNQDLSIVIQALRSTKSLPMCLEQPVKILQNSFNRQKTVFDQEYLFMDQKIDQDKIMSIFAQTLNISGSKISKSFFGCALSLDNVFVEQQIDPIDSESDKQMEKIHTPGVKSMDDLESFFNIPKNQMLKLVCYEYNGKLVFIYIRGDLNVSVQKLNYELGLSPFAEPFKMAPISLLEQHGLCEGFGGFSGAKLYDKMTILFDNSVQNLNAAITGANDPEYHFINYNFKRDNPKQMKFVKFCDLVQNFDVQQNEQIFVEGVLSKAQIPLMGNSGKLQNIELFTVKIRYYDCLLNYRIDQFNVAFTALQIPQKFEDQYNQAQNIIKSLNKKFYNIIDERSKVTLNQKLELGKKCIYKYIFIFNKNLTEEECDGLVYENNEYVEKRIQFSEL